MHKLHVLKIELSFEFSCEYEVEKKRNSAKEKE